MDRDDLKKAFREAAAIEYVVVPSVDSDIDHTFSPKFEKRMEKLIQSEQKTYWHYVNTAGKRLAVAAIILILLFLTACGIPPVRKFFLKTYRDHFDVIYHGSEEESQIYKIEYEYQFVVEPEGFVLTSYQDFGNVIQRVYENQKGDVLYLDQGVAIGMNMVIDNEHGEVFETNVDGRIVYIYKNNEDEADAMTATWNIDEYIFVLSYYGKTDMDTICEFIHNIE